MKKIKIVTVVWGEEFIDLFLGHYLPTWMSKEDLGDPKLMENVDFTVYTRKWVDKERIEAHPTYQRLQAMLPCDVLCHAVVGRQKFDSVNMTHKRVIKANSRYYDGFIVLWPDSILNIGAFKHIITNAQNYKLVYGAVNTRVVADDLLPNFSKYTNPDGTITSDNAFRVLRDYTHTITKSYIFNNNGMGTRHPCTTFWVVNDDCWIGRAMHQYPFYIEMNYLLEFTHPDRHPYLDSAIINSKILDPDDIYVFHDTDQIILIDFTFANPNDSKLGMISKSGYTTEDLMAGWYKISRCMNTKLRPLDESFKLHCSDNNENFEKKTKEVEEIVQRYYHKYLGD